MQQQCKLEQDHRFVRLRTNGHFEANAGAAGCLIPKSMCFDNKGSSAMGSLDLVHCPPFLAKNLLVNAHNGIKVFT